MRRSAHRIIAWACALLCCSFSARSRAELGDDVTRLLTAWRDHGVVRHLPPRLGERLSPSVVFLPVELLSGNSSSCISVVVLGPNSIHFTLRAVGGAYLPESVEDWPQASLAGLVQKFEQAGLGQVVNSWVGTGANQPVSADQLGGVLGGDMVAGLARQLGLNPQDALGQLSQMLPQVVDKLTPQGQIPQGDLGGMGAAGGLGDLAGLLGGLLNQPSSR